MTTGPRPWMEARCTVDEHDVAAGAGGTSPGAPDVVRALRSVLTSSAFASSRRSREFLSYVVTEQLSGRGDRLSERTVGRRALGLDGSFDGRRDSSVRVRATRVRAALAAYYAGAGATDAVRIHLPPGSYAPAFVVTTPDPPTSRPELGPGLVVVHLEPGGDAGADLIGTTVVEALVQRLLPFGLPVVGPVTTRFEDPRDIAREFSVRFVVQGTVTLRGGALRLSVRLVDGCTGSTVWATSSTGAEAPGFDLEDAWATELAAQLGDSAGVLHHYELGHPVPTRGSSTQAALRAFSACQQLETPESLAAALDAMDRAIAEGERSATLLALRAWVGAAAVSYGFTEHSELDRCEALGREAAGAAPADALPQVGLGMVALVRHDHDLAAHHGHAAAARAPHHPTVLFAAATLTCAAGDLVHAEAYAREAFRLNPQHPGQYRWLLALARLLDDDPAQALAEASLVNTPGFVWGNLYRALALSGVGHPEQAEVELRRVVELEPSFPDDPLAVFPSWMRISPENADRLLHYVEPILAVRGSGGHAPRPAT